MGLGHKSPELQTRDDAFDLALAVMKYDEALNAHPDAPSRRPTEPAVVEVQAYYEEMRERAKDLVQKISRDCAGNSRG
jgi:hypothetical protein